MNKDLSYWVDIFVPKAYTQPAVNDSLYMVIMPCLLNKPEEVISYLDSFTDQAQTVTFNPLTITSGNEGEQIELVPLPFHPATVLTMDGKRINQYGNQTGYSFASVSDKLRYALDNYSGLPLQLLPEAGYPADDYKYLNQSQRDQYGNWLISLLTDVKKNELTITPGTLKADVLAWYKPDFIDKIRIEITKTIIDNSICTSFLKLLLASPGKLANETDLMPHGFQFSIEALNQLAEDIPALTSRIGSELNYNKIVAQGFLSIYHKAGPATIKSDPLAKAIEQITIYYGGGERVRVPSLAANFNNMLVADDFTATGFENGVSSDLLPSGNFAKTVLTLTNNYSLLGHVISIPFSNLSADIDAYIKALRVQLNGREIFDASLFAGDLRIQIKAAYLNATQNTPQSFQRDIHINPKTNPSGTLKGKVFYHPVTSGGIPDNALNEGDPSKQFFLVPELLLDEMESAPRVEYGQSKSNLFIDFPPQRKFFRLADIWGNGITKDDGSFIHPPVYNGQFLPGITLRVMLKRARLANGNIIYKLSKKRKGFCARDDEKRFDTLLSATVYTDPVLASCYLGYSSKETGADKYTLKKLSLISGIPADADELLEIYTTDDLSKLLEQGDAVQTKEMDLLLLPNAATANFFWACFNLLTAPAKNGAGNPLAIEPPLVALKNRFKYKFNISVNGFSANLESKLEIATGFVPSGLASSNDALEPVITDYRNFNKFRVYLNDGIQDIKINEADALFPEFESHQGTTGLPPWSFFYTLTHRFMESTSGTGTRREADDQEEPRYRLYKNGGKPLTLKGWIEHQYAYRLATRSANPAYAGFSGPIRHIGQLLVLKTAKTKQLEGVTAQNAKEEIPALFFKLTGDVKITATLNGKYLDYLRAEKSLQYYREFYEAIYDLGNKSSTLRLIVEEWDFDNRYNSLAPGDAAHPEIARKFPAILDHLNKINKTAAGVTLSKNLDVFLTDTFVAFKAAVDKATEMTLFEVTLKGALTGDIARVGLEINRDGATTVMQQFLNGGQVDPVAEDLMPTPYRIDPNTVAANAFLSANDALTGLKSYLDSTADRNELYQSFSFIYSKSYLDGFKPDNHINEILGETAKYTAFPSTTVTHTDALTYYVPYSFRPVKLASWAGSALTSPVDQYEFVNYLLNVLSWLAYPESRNGDLSNLISLQWPDPDTKMQALHVRSRVRDEFLRGINGMPGTAIADKLTALLTFTDNEANISGPGSHQIVKKIRDSIKTALSASFSSIFTADPYKYVTVKALGIGLFTTNKADGSPSGNFDDLYSFKINKEIAPQKAAATAKIDTTHFNFLSLLEDKTAKQTYYIDELSDELYDNEFTISTKEFADIEGRTAENILENALVYGTDGTGKAKLTIKPYCISWQAKNENFYLLPSRKPPAVPIEVTLLDAEKMLIKSKFLAGKNADWKDVIKKLTDPFNLSSGEATQSAAASLAFTAYSGPVFYNAKPDDPGVLYNRYDSYVNQHYFLLDPDEEGEISNDKFEIIIDNAPTAASNPQILNSVRDERLLKALEDQFQFHVRKPKDGQTTLPPPSMDIKDLVSVSEPYDNAAGLHQVLLDLLEPAEKEQNNLINSGTIFELHPTGKTWELVKKGAASPSSSVPGDIIATNLLIYRSPGVPNGAKYLLKIMVLSDPWTSYRCCVRVRRNERDLDMNGVPDLNPAFSMLSAYSAWSDYGVQTLSYNYLEAADPLLWEDNLKYLKPNLSIDAFKINRNLENVISNLLNNPAHFGGQVMTYHFLQLVSNRPGYTLAPVFNAVKSADSIRSWAATYGDKIDLVNTKYDGGTAAPGMEKILPVDRIVNPVPDTVVGLAPFIKMIWYHPDYKHLPVFSINWQIRLKQT